MVIVFEVLIRMVVTFMLILITDVMDVRPGRLSLAVFAFLMVVFVILSPSGTVGFTIMIGVLRSILRRLLWADP
jgi:hypothetical protein